MGLAVACVFQVRSGESPDTSATVVDRIHGMWLFSGSLLSVLIAHERRGARWKVGLWTVLTVAFGLLALDEVLEFHEATEYTLGNDDYIKVAAWLSGLVGAASIIAIERPSPAVSRLLMLALASQTCWLLADLGDGDWFTAPLAFSTLAWIEELSELLATQCYVTGFATLYRQGLTTRIQTADS